MTREEIFRATQDADARIEALRQRIRQAPEAPLPSGDWRVRDALSHIAARGNAVPMVQRRLEQADHAAAGGPPPPPFDIDAINAEQVRDRTGNSVDQLLDELLAGHQATRNQLAGLSDDVLARRLTIPFPPGELSVADLIVRAGVGHEGTHLDQIEAALAAQ